MAPKMFPRMMFVLLDRFLLALMTSSPYR